MQGYVNIRQKTKKHYLVYISIYNLRILTVIQEFQCVPPTPPLACRFSPWLHATFAPRLYIFTTLDYSPSTIPEFRNLDFSLYLIESLSISGL